MHDAISIITTIFGCISISVVSKWSRWVYKYKFAVKAPMVFSKNPLVYWSLPIAIFFLTLMLGSIPFPYLLFVYGISMETGQIIAKREYINKIAEFIIKDDGTTFKEAIAKAKRLEKATKLWRKY